MPASRRPALRVAALALLAIAAAIVVRARARHRRARAHRRRAVAPTAPQRGWSPRRPDPLAKDSFPDPAGARTHARAAAPSVAGSAASSPGAPSLSEVRHQLKEEHNLQAASRDGRDEAPYVDPQTGAFTPSNVVPLAISEVIAGGNAIADFPYVYGGGHASFVDRAYDCSGSVSYALAAAGLIGAPETSGQLEHWGAPGPGPPPHGLRQRRPHLHVRGRPLVRHGGPRRPLQHALADGRPRSCGATPCATTRVSERRGSVHAPIPRAAHAPPAGWVHAPSRTASCC